MNLITLTPKTEVSPAMCLRSPGAVLKHDYLEAKNISLAQLGRLTGIRHYYLSMFVAGTRRLSADEAMRLAVVLGTSGFYWLALQARFELAAEWRRREIEAPMVW